jgi:uncharacterized protein (DUF305 family)
MAPVAASWKVETFMQSAAPLCNKQRHRKVMVGAAALLVTAWVLAADETEAPFLKENDAAMSRMMAAMAVQPTGDVDRDFVATMVPHHQGAIEMAQAQLRYGKNEQLRRLAQQIIVEQTQEIAVMRLAIEDSRK